MSACKPSTLPENLEQVTISHLRDNETAYTLYWAIQVHLDGGMWIRGDYPAVQRGEHPNAAVKITRRGNIIEVSRSTLPPEARYSRSDVSHAVRFWEAMPVRLVP